MFIRNECAWKIDRNCTSCCCSEGFHYTVQWSDKYDPKITHNCLKRAKIGRKLITWEKIMLNSHSIIVILNNVENYLYAGFPILKLLNLSSNFQFHVAKVLTPCVYISLNHLEKRIFLSCCCITTLKFVSNKKGRLRLFNIFVF